ncbi:MAG: hypothetical protein QM759_00010 [Terricaulis sp.]
MAVFAAGFALYALVAPLVGPPAAAAIVALVAALIVALFALFTAMQARKREREHAAAQAQMMSNLPAELGEIIKDRPMVSLAVTLVGGILAARHPRMARDLLSLAARFTRSG